MEIVGGEKNVESQPIPRYIVDESQQNSTIRRGSSTVGKPEFLQAIQCSNTGEDIIQSFSRLFEVNQYQFSILLKRLRRGLVELKVLSGPENENIQKCNLSSPVVVEIFSKLHTLDKKQFFTAKSSILAPEKKSALHAVVIPDDDPLIVQKKKAKEIDNIGLVAVSFNDDEIRMWIDSVYVQIEPHQVISTLSCDGKHWRDQIWDKIYLKANEIAPTMVNCHVEEYEALKDIDPRYLNNFIFFIFLHLTLF